MASRLQLQALLVSKLGSGNVYYQPPESIKLKYPCIIYELADIVPILADNIKYNTMKRYNITYVDTSPDSSVVDEILKMPYTAYDRRYTADNLYHDVIELYY